MTPAEFDTRRRSLGLSTREAAALCGVQERTLNRWQAGDYAIPQDAVDALDALEESMSDAVENVVTFATDNVESGPVILWRYRTQAVLDRSEHASGMPLGAHAMMIAWAADALAAEGIGVQIEWAKAQPSPAP